MSVPWHLNTTEMIQGCTLKRKASKIKTNNELLQHGDSNILMLSRATRRMALIISHEPSGGEKLFGRSWDEWPVAWLRGYDGIGK